MSIIDDITDFIFVLDEPRKADLIVAVGGSHPAIPEKAAELFNQGFAPFLAATGMFSCKLGRFRGTAAKTEIYNKYYSTECDFYCDVFTKNGVPRSAVIREDKSEYTRQNADFLRGIVDKRGIRCDTVMVVCKSFHARRCQIFFQSAFGGSRVLMIPVDIQTGEGRDDWFKSEKGIERILGELKRCGEQTNAADILRFAAKTGG